MSDGLSPAERLRLDALFERAVEMAVADRAAFVARECATNTALRRELERLLSGLAGEDLLGRARMIGPLRAGTRLGPYELREKIGEGGMGEVYAAEQREPLERKVALKVIKAGMDSAEIVARFEAERQAQARMAHPYIAQVFDAGATEQGRPYFVMEFVEGDAITVYCDQRKLSTHERVELFCAVCEGVQHAHQKGVVHRDLKPSNVIVTQVAGRPAPKVIDFGVARATKGRLGQRSMQTLVGQVVGTLDYMSPEQADPTGVDIDTRSDIYSLGVLLYQLISGLLPFDHASAEDVPFFELQRAIREVDAPTPSARLERETDTATTIAPLHGTDHRSLVRQLHGDLDWICLKALEKDPARRYASASELADDLRRHLAHQPVLAGRPGSLYRLRKFVRRHRSGVLAGALVAGAAMTGAVGLIAGRLEARAKTLLAQRAMDAERPSWMEQQALALWPPHPAKIEAMRAWLDSAHELVDGLPAHRARLQRILERADPADPKRPAEPRFDSPGAAFEYQVLAKLVDGIERLNAGLLAPAGTSKEYGWSVPKRLAFALHMQAGFAPGGEFEPRWKAAREGVRASSGLELAPQMGLLPIGVDPDSGLWEFWHMASGAEPVRERGELVLTVDTGLVFVLIPGGAFWMGAQSEDTEQHNFERRSAPAEHPVHEVELSPYFLSKFEMTQGQWKRLTGHNPSGFGPDGKWDTEWLASGEPATLLHPVEQVSWQDCADWLPRAGLLLPSEAQWERGARAGTETEFWSGPAVADLEYVANLRDEFMESHGAETWQNFQTGFNDGAAVHAPVGTFNPNRFGLHEVHGNVWEWCRDGYDKRAYERSAAVDPVSESVGEVHYVYRGGSFRFLALHARSATRFFDPPSKFGTALGVRPARQVH